MCKLICWQFSMRNVNRTLADACTGFSYSIGLSTCYWYSGGHNVRHGGAAAFDRQCRELETLQVYNETLGEFPPDRCLGDLSPEEVAGVTPLEQTAAWAETWFAEYPSSICRGGTSLSIKESCVMTPSNFTLDACRRICFGYSKFSPGHTGQECYAFEFNGRTGLCEFWQGMLWPPQRTDGAPLFPFGSPAPPFREIPHPKLDWARSCHAIIRIKYAGNPYTDWAGSRCRGEALHTSIGAGEIGSHPFPGGASPFRPEAVHAGLEKCKMECAAKSYCVGFEYERVKAGPPEGSSVATSAYCRWQTYLDGRLVNESGEDGGNRTIVPRGSLPFLGSTEGYSCHRRPDAPPSFYGGNWTASYGRGMDPLPRGGSFGRSDVAAFTNATGRRALSTTATSSFGEASPPQQQSGRVAINITGAIAPFCRAWSAAHYRDYTLRKDNTSMVFAFGSDVADVVYHLERRSDSASKDVAVAEVIRLAVELSLPAPAPEPAPLTNSSAGAAASNSSILGRRIRQMPDPLIFFTPVSHRSGTHHLCAACHVTVHNHVLKNSM